MNRASLKILQRLVREREMCLAELSQLLQKKFGDYRDYYPLAGLCAEDLARTELRSPNKQEELGEKFLATYFYAHTLGVGKHRVNNYIAMNRGGEEKTIKVHATAKGDSFITERRARILERTITIGISFLLGVASMWIKTQWFSS
jgi:hypothetical protein